jgi:outer membrane protein assembly factor BamB
MKSTHTQRKQTASFRITGSMLAIAPLWLMLAAANTSAYAQTSDNVSKTSATTTPAPSPGDWTQYLRNNMQRWNPYETVLGVGNVGGLQLKWKSIPMGSDLGNNLESSPAVVNGVVYVASDSNGSVYALNASTGAQLWSFATGADLLASPAVANGVVYVEQYDGSNLYALDASTGAQLWSDNIGSSLSSPTVVNGVVYIGGGDALYALNASTGAVLWSYATGGPVWSSPAVVNGVVYVGSWDQNVYALNASTGAKLWSYATGARVISSPAVANGEVYIGSLDLNVYALNASTGAKLWSYATGGGVWSSPAVVNGVVYVGSFDGNMYALNASTGAKLWSYAAGGDSSPAVANGVVYVGSDDNNMYALNASTGAKLWSYTTGYYVFSSPTIVVGVVYLNAADASGQWHVYAFGLGSANSADLYLRIIPTTTTVHQGDLITYAFPVWNLGPDVAAQEVLNTQVPAGTAFDYIRISGTPGLGTCTYTPYLGAGPIPIVCDENSVMALNTTWTVRLTVKVTAPAGTVITENAATMADTPDPNMANNTATVSLTVVP